MPTCPECGGPLLPNRQWPEPPSNFGTPDMWQCNSRHGPFRPDEIGRGNAIRRPDSKKEYRVQDL